MKRVLRVGLVGGGRMGKNHARVLSEMPGVSLVALVDPLTPSEAAFGDSEIFQTLDSLFSLHLDFVVVATPTATHEDIACRLLRGGVNVFIEKPLALDLKAALRIVGAMREAGSLGAVGHVERFNPGLRELKRRLTGGEIGNVLQVATRRQGSFPVRVADVGVTLDLGTHDIDATRWISGAEYRSISANATYRSGRSREDMVLISGVMTDGVIINHVVNWLSPMKERVITVTGDRGTFVADLLTGDLSLHENGAFQIEWSSLASFRGVTEGNVTRFAYDKIEPLRRQMDNFVALVSGDVSESVSLEEGAKAVEVAESAIESFRTGKVVNLPLDGA